MTFSLCGMDKGQNKHRGRKKEAEVALASARARAVGECMPGNDLLQSQEADMADLLRTSWAF